MSLSRKPTRSRRSLRRATSWSTLLADAVNVPNDPAAPKNAGDCVGNDEYMPDGSWKGSGTCTYTFKGGDKVNDSWEEGSQLKEYIYKFTGGTGKYQGASGGGTYMYENITDTLAGALQDSVPRS